ncbi:methionyl-tRNA formyltransferase [Tissierella carlieri]|uniref:Methionyl-tRNA formyltransferase n=1 Tax=Tissierella carlieri TaxID=689904 RepID=A0ABT1S9U1_9FIRM|nr:methionyl-tRNA formyltransferase [Tissierella carlieri]MCQ4923219.1 methionyl-tRNA formyltransferase [Tissierella carlieri]
MDKKCVFIGSKDLGLKALKKIITTCPNTILGCITYDDSKDIRSKLGDFKEYCKGNKIDLIILKKPNELKSIIKKMEPNFCFVIGWYWIIDYETLKLCNDGFIGIHASLLPKYRGCSPLVWTLINGEEETGVSMFYFNEEIDSGDLIAQKEIKISNNDYIDDVLKKVEKEVFNIIEHQYPLIIKGMNNRYKQDNKEISYCAQRRPEDGRINWNKTAEEIYNFIRAQSHPYPGAFIITRKDEKVKIFKSEIFKYKYYGTPGQIVKIEKNTILVICKQGALNLSIENKYTDEEIREMFKYGDILS